MRSMPLTMVISCWARFNPDTGEPLSQREIPITVLVGTEHVYAVEIKSLQAEKSRRRAYAVSGSCQYRNVDLMPGRSCYHNGSWEFVERAVLVLGKAPKGNAAAEAAAGGSCPRP